MTTDTALSTDTTSSTKSRTTVLVTFHPDSKKLTVEPTKVEARAGDVIVWRFKDAPLGYEPVIQFSSTAASTKTVYDTGPLASLCLFSGGITGALDRDGGDGTFPYRVTFVPRPGTGADTLDLNLVAAPRIVRIGTDGNKDPQSSGD